ncbi:transketolase [Magnetospirillum moscoviense]|uniref:Transketolase n=1 Tax=Magnetospirillum moscoviense TaxID=1437059 RepID=A0A178MBL3_9PROT|nr:transketolase [Magnetospirillum moscoviense]OAN45408.1 transketolase [Magnetospirillum moscoviense]
MTSPPLDDRSRHLRRLAISAIKSAGIHFGATMSLIEILRVLYDDILRIDPKRPDDPDRDRCILSKGHGVLALYAILADKGFFPTSEIATFCAVDSRLPGHPEHGLLPGIEASTGALGHGLSIGLGMALAARIQKRPSRVFVVMGDGETNEGSVWEAAMSAAKHGLDNLVAIIDYNKLQSYGPVEQVQPLEPLADKWRAFGFAVAQADGHDPADLKRVLGALPVAAGQPSLVIAHTVKGKGLSLAEGVADWHHKRKLTEAETAAIIAELGGM